MHTVYRVEHPLTSKGPYHTYYEHTQLLGNARFVISQMCNEHNSRSTVTVDTHPGVAGDIGEPINEDTEHCGFESIESLKAWFGEWLDPLLKAGFVIVTYEVESFKRGKYQIAFKKNNTERIFDIIEASLKEL